MKTTLLAIAALAGLVLVLCPCPEPAQPTPHEAGPRDLVAPATLVDWLVSGDRHVHLVDVRPVAAFLRAGIRTAESMPADSIDAALLRAIPVSHPVVVYGDSAEDARSAFSRIKAIHDRTYLLSGGYAAWRDEVLTAGAPPDTPDEDAWSAYLTRVALVKYLRGESDDAPAPARRTVQPTARPRIKVANEGC